VAEKRPRIHILYKFIEGPWGGANQFLHALRGYFRKTGVYAEKPEDAEVILFNSYPFGNEHLFDMAYKLKRKEPNKILIHRVDGPIFYVRGRHRVIDDIIYAFNKLFTDGTIFISNLCRQDNYRLGFRRPRYETVILGAPDPTIFNSRGKKPFSRDKIKLIATSWSSNIRKGFDTYKFLDEQLDFNKYKMSFVGNSPIEFKNIKSIKAVNSRKLADILKEHDIYITATKYEPFGQAVIEALHCGLPAVVRTGGGYLQAAGNMIEVFQDESDILEAIEKVAQNYEYYQKQMNLPTLKEIAGKYYDFAYGIYRDYLSGDYHPKRVNTFRYLSLLVPVAKWKVLNIIERIKNLGFI